MTVNGTNGYKVFVNYYRIADDSESTQTLESENVILGETQNTATYEVETNNTAAYRVVAHDNGGKMGPNGGPVGPSASDVGDITVTSLSLGNDSLDGGPVGFGGDSGNGTIIGILAVVALVLVIRKA